MRINIERLNRLTDNNTETPSTTNIEQNMIEYTVHRFLNGKKLNKIQKNLLKDYQIIGKKSKSTSKESVK